MANSKKQQLTLGEIYSFFNGVDIFRVFQKGEVMWEGNPSTLTGILKIFLTIPIDSVNVFTVPNGKDKVKTIFACSTNCIPEISYKKTG